MTALYETDILLWSERQADLLRRAAAGERPNDLDWENIVEEVESAGRSQFQSVESLLEIALRHLLLAYGSLNPEPVQHWLVEASAALRQTRKRATPSMIARLDLPEIWTDARDYADGKLRAQGGVARPLPQQCAFTVDQLFRSAASAHDLLTILTSDAPGNVNA